MAGQDDNTSATATDKPAVLIIGGMGYIGRFLALHIHKHKLASEVRLVDKVLPQLAWLAPEFKEACSPDKFVQADASREQSMPRIYDRANGKEFDYVFNCGGETRYSQEDEVYRLRSLNLSLCAGREAARRHIPVFVEVSTGMVYDPKSAPRKETDKTKPWTAMARYKLLAEEELSKIDGLNLVVLRLAHVYGEYDTKFVATALTLARVYQALGKEMRWLWTRDLKVNTVHITDVARALWASAEWYRAGKKGWDEKWGKVPLFNIVDHGQTSQGTLAHLIHAHFHIPTGFQGSVISSFARLNLDDVVDDVNDEILGPWADLLAQANITRPGPLSPFMERELLREQSLSLDGKRFEEVVGFKCEVEALGERQVEECVDSYRRMGWWP